MIQSCRGEDYSDGLKASDSIQRAMTDMYRTAKLLHNFAIMNYTGFVKIVKKHDKTFKEYKGRFKQLTIESEVCNGGKDVAKLEERMVRYSSASHFVVNLWTRCVSYYCMLLLVMPCRFGSTGTTVCRLVL